MVVELTDSYVISLPSLYVSSLILALRSMLQLELPHINVLTKIDNLPSYGRLPMPLGFYTEARSLEHLEPHLETEQSTGRISNEMSLERGVGVEGHSQSKFHALNRAIIQLVEDYSLVGFETLCVEDRKSMWQLLRAIDRAGGYAFGGQEGVNSTTAWELAVREGGGGQIMEIGDIEERWLTRRHELDEAEKEQWREEAEQEQKRVDQDANATKAPKSSASGIKVVRKG